MLADSSPTHHADPETEEALAMASDTDLSPLPPMISSLLNDLPPSYPKMDQMIMDYFGAGSVMGEMGILENKTCNATVECETDVQVMELWAMHEIANSNNMFTVAPSFDYPSSLPPSFPPSLLSLSRPSSSATRTLLTSWPGFLWWTIDCGGSVASGLPPSCSLSYRNTRSAQLTHYSRTACV